MCTGDNLQTARAIALECGILTDPNVSEPIVIEGKTFRELSDLEREEVAEKICVCSAFSLFYLHHVEICFSVNMNIDFGL
jgi:magnesium-transporting ATPase (P-type)